MKIHLAVFSATHELVSVEEIIAVFIKNEVIPRGAKINEYFSFRCPICFFPVAFSYFQDPSIQSRFNHIGDLKDQECKLYTGKYGQPDIPPKEGEINRWDDIPTLFERYFNFRSFLEWEQLDELDANQYLPILFKKNLYKRNGKSIFIWLFPIDNFFNIIKSHYKLKEFRANMRDFLELGDNCIVLYYTKNKKKIPYDAISLKERLTIFLRDLNIVMFELVSRPTVIFHNNRIWGNFEGGNEINFLKNASLLNLEECEFDYDLVKEHFLKKDTFLDRRSKETILGWYEFKERCSNCRNLINFSIVLRINGKTEIFPRKDRSFIETSYAQLKCKRCEQIVFDLPNWKAHVKKTSIEALLISAGDKIKFICGTYEGHEGIVLKKLKHNQIIKVLLDNKKTDNQPIYFARKLS